VENFVSGASSVKTCRRLIERDYKLFHVDDLHAKLVIVSGSCATLGSQNLTTAGTKRLEASVVLTSADDVLALERAVQYWVKNRRPIDLDEIAEIERHIPNLTRRARELREETSAASETVKNTRQQREFLKREKNERERLASERNKLREQRQRDLILRGLKAVQSLTPLGEVPYALATHFVRESVWKRRDRSGNPHPSPGYVDYVVGPEGDWRLDISRGGGNKFLIARAIRRCISVAGKFLEDFRDKKPVTYDAMRVRLWEEIHRSVANTADQEYQGRYSKDDDWIMLGWVGIRVNLFVDEFLRLTNLDKILRDLGFT
jgi:hypothetical protein